MILFFVTRAPREAAALEPTVVVLAEHPQLESQKVVRSHSSIVNVRDLLRNKQTEQLC